MKSSIYTSRTAQLFAVSLAATVLAGCDSSSSTSQNTVTPFTSNLANCESSGTATTTDASGNFLLAARAADYSAGQMELRSMADASVQQAYPATSSDIQAATDGVHAYQIGRLSLDNLTKFNLDSDVPVYQYSVNATDETLSNPYTIIFAQPTKAYIIRYGVAKVWIVDPTATSEANFKIGEVDLSAYDTGSPNASGAVLVDNKLYVLMERLGGSSGYTPDKQGYIAVIDTTTDTEIDTGQGTVDGLLGIPLGVRNPTGLQYSESNDLLYVIGRGNIYGSYDPDSEDTSKHEDRFTGGIVTVDPENYQASLLLDDGTEQSNVGFFNQLSVVGADKAYLLNYESYGSSTLLRLNATTGIIEECAVAGIKSSDVGLLGQSPNGQLWMSNNGAQPSIQKIDMGTDLATESIEVALNPINVVFIP